MAKTAQELIAQVMAATGNTRISSWCLSQLNTLLLTFYREHTWPFLMTYVETLSTTPGQADTSYAALTDFWKPTSIQVVSSPTTLEPVLPIRGGLPAYFGDVGRRGRMGRPRRYALERATGKLWWDATPTATETICLAYQRDPSALTPTATPELSTHTRNGELFLYYWLLSEAKLYHGDATEGDLVKQRYVKVEEAKVLGERLSDQDDTPAVNGNEVYV